MLFGMQIKISEMTRTNETTLWQKENNTVISYIQNGRTQDTSMSIEYVSFWVDLK